MSQLASIYRFRVRRSGDAKAPWQPLGDIDNGGTRLIDVITDFLTTLDHMREVEGHDDPQPIASYARDLTLPNDYLAGAVLHHFEYGSRGLLNRVAQGDRYPFTEADNQQVEVRLIIKAPPLATAGFLVFQLNNRRSVKTAVELELRRWLRDAHDLFLDVSPVAPTEAVEEAIRQYGVGPVTFRKMDDPAGLFSNEGDWWADGEDLAVAEYRLRPARNHRFLGERILRFIRFTSGDSGDGDGLDFPELATFNGTEYDELAVEIRIHGRPKTLYIRPEGTDMSHAFNWELDLPASANDDEFTEALVELIPEQ